MEERSKARVGGGTSRISNELIKTDETADRMDLR